MNNTGYLEVQELSIGYSGVRQPLFAHITANIEGGMLVGLFGRNGIGKSTLLKTLSGLQRPVGGKFLLFGADAVRLSASELAKKIAFVPSQPLRTQRLSVADMVSVGRYGFTNWFGAEQEGDKMAVTKALELTSLSHLAQRDSATLSDGELQRAAIARSLVQDTPLILLDEPTAFLDMGNKYKTVALLKELTRTGQKGILFSTHDLSLALQVCDALWIMADDGFYADTPERLVNNGVIDVLFASFGLSKSTTPPSSCGSR